MLPPRGPRRCPPRRGCASTLPSALKPHLPLLPSAGLSENSTASRGPDPQEEQLRLQLEEEKRRCPSYPPRIAGPLEPSGRGLRGEVGPAGRPETAGKRGTAFWQGLAGARGAEPNPPTPRAQARSGQPCALPPPGGGGERDPSLRASPSLSRGNMGPAHGHVGAQGTTLATE